jgi:hypothetical protein
MKGEAQSPPPPAELFSPAGLCAILTECSVSGVRRFRMCPDGTLEVDFFHQGEPDDAPTSSRKTPEATGSPSPIPIQNVKEALEEGETRLRSQQLETLRMTDPEAYEEAVFEGDLVPAQEDDENAGEIAE